MPPKPTLPPGIQMALRRNRAEHPGAPDQKKAKRSSEQVAAEKAAKEQDKRDRAAKKARGITNAARVEDKMQEQDDRHERDANHPPPNTIQKILRPRKERPAGDKELEKPG